MKKALFFVLSFVMMMAFSMTVCAETETDYSPTFGMIGSEEKGGSVTTSDDSDSNYNGKGSVTSSSSSSSSSSSTSPKTADYGMTEVALALFVISGGVLYFTKRELDRA